MLKTLLCTATATFLLCGPALANSERVAPSYDVGLVVTGAKGPRSYQLSVVAPYCGEIKSKQHDAKLEDEIQVCARASGERVTLDVSWTSREDDRELRTRSMKVAQRGGAFSLENGGSKLTVSMR